ncbi:MAG: hypothetical protein MK106_07880 [Mariniblastus sp.]|nr:hypothetical protein [Mariniblastus sp.]
MKRPRIKISLGDERLTYRPGDVMIGQYMIDPVDDDKIVAVESSVIWLTDGKGEGDMGVHFFDRQKGPFDVAKLRQLKRFSTVLPASPFSYNGTMIRVRWAVRIRVFFEVGSEHTEDLYFQLGNVISSLSPPSVE